MTKTDLNRFRAVLIARIAELERFTHRRDVITIERRPDDLEEIQQASERALAVCNLDRDCKQLRDAQAALRRIQDGSFGTCERCENDIHPKRLAAIPWAALCIGCQDARDRNPEEMPTATHDVLVSAA